MTHFKILILGGGSGGISIASKLIKSFDSKNDSSLIAILEPSEDHYYQPWWTLAGSGLVKKECSHRYEKDLIPKGVSWLKDSVKKVFPNENKVLTLSGSEIKYDFLIVSTGLKLDWNKIKGIEGNLGKHGIYSIYEYDNVDKTAQAIEKLNEGTAIFTMPPVPIKCAGAPQKIMYLAEENFSKRGVRNKIKVLWMSNSKSMFGVVEYGKVLAEVAKRKNIETHFYHKLIEVDPINQIAKFDILEEKTKDGGAISIEKTSETSVKYNFLHVVPPMSAHDYVKESGLAFSDGPQSGWLKVNQFTLQHLDFKNIFGIGDVTGVPNSKTGAAVRKMTPVVVANLLSVMEGREPVEKYNGYSSCPLITSSHSVILAEFGYDNKLMPSFPLDSTKERWIYWLLKRYLLPKLYWWGMMKGRS